MHLIEAADRTPSGVPPMPQRRSTGDSGCTASNAADTSPCEMKRMRAPARRISSTASSCRSRFSIITVTSRTSTPFSLAIRPTVSVNGRSRSSRCAKAGCAAIFSMYTAGPGSNIVPRSDIAITANARGEPSAARVVPSRGSTAMSVCGGDPSPMCSPLYSIGASSFSPSPITTTPSIGTVSSISRIASTAAPSAFSFSPSPTQRPAASAPASVTRTSSSARLRSGCEGSRTSCEITCWSASAMGPGYSASPSDRGHERPPITSRYGLRPPLLSGVAWWPLERGGWLAPGAAPALHCSEAAGYEDADRGEQREPVPEREAHLQPLLGLVDQAVVGDQHEGGEADDRGQLPARPGECMSAHHDPGEDEGRGRRENQQDADDREGVPGAAAGVADPAGPVGGVVAALYDARVGRQRIPLEEEADHQHRRGPHADDLRAVELGGVHGATLSRFPSIGSRLWLSAGD